MTFHRLLPKVGPDTYLDRSVSSYSVSCANNYCWRHGPGLGGPDLFFFAGVHVSMLEQSGRSPWESGFLFFRTSPPCDSKCLSSIVSYHKATPYSFFAAAFVLKLACLQLQHIFSFFRHYVTLACRRSVAVHSCCALAGCAHQPGRSVVG